MVAGGHVLPQTQIERQAAASRNMPSHLAAALNLVVIELVQAIRKIAAGCDAVAALCPVAPTPFNHKRVPTRRV
jgi:hypothetical protein